MNMKGEILMYVKIKWFVFRVCCKLISLILIRLLIFLVVRNNVVKVELILVIILDLLKLVMFVYVVVEIILVNVYCWIY